ncbi:MAG TPA: hypothetical protein VGE38_11255 [Nocardioides sp.]|uniref:hypothetical protein n=1 Tax=Nocardioides sp. TaxID=35761 RepID=UPI002ED88672
MSDRAQWDDLDEAELLDRVEARARELREAEADLLRLAFAWAVRHPRERLPERVSGKPGREQARLFGGDGTPEVTEFAAASFGARVGLSPSAARTLMADALDLQHRLPLLWGRVEALEVKASYARHVARQTRDLTRDQAGYVDSRVHEAADGRIAWSRFEALVKGAVVAADLEAAREREERASKATFAKRTRGDAHGMASFLVRADVATIEAIDHAVTAVASRLDEAAGATVDERRVSAVLHLLTGHTGLDEHGQPQTLPSRDLLPAATIYVHTYQGLDAPGVARIEGHGPVTEDWIARVLGPRATIRLQPVIDLSHQAPVDAYEIPQRHRRAVRLMTPADCFPFASDLDGLDPHRPPMDIDHTVPHEAGGRSAQGNYGPMTRWHHRIKTHGDWEVKQPFPGIYLWRDPYGLLYLVDHTGTRVIRRPGLTVDYVLTS